jgi:hypothetical protein
MDESYVKVNVPSLSLNSPRIPLLVPSSSLTAHHPSHLFGVLSPSRHQLPATMKFLACLSLLASALAVRLDVAKRDSPLKVEIQSVGNSAVKAVVTNTGSEPIRLMKTGSILDKAAVEKAEIFSGGMYKLYS